MQIEQLERLPRNLYPADSVHAKELRKHFGRDFLRELTAEEADELGGMTFSPLVFSNRSGSNLLSELLVQAGMGFYPLGEPMNVASIRRISDRHGLSSFTDYMLFLVRRYRRDDLVGFKLSIGQLFDLTRLGVLQHFEEVKLVHSVRRDLLAQAISHYKARETGKWMSRTDQDTPTDVPYEGEDIMRCLQVVTMRRGHYEYFRSLHRVPGVNIFYEDVLNDPVAAVTRVAEFLNKPADTSAVDVAAVAIKQQRDSVNKALRTQFVADYGLGTG